MEEFSETHLIICQKIIIRTVIVSAAGAADYAQYNVILRCIEMCSEVFITLSVKPGKEARNVVFIKMCYFSSNYELYQ